MTTCSTRVELWLLLVLRVLLSVVLTKELIGDVAIVLDGGLLFVLLFLILIETRPCSARCVSHDLLLFLIDYINFGAFLLLFIEVFLLIFIVA